MCKRTLAAVLLMSAGSAFAGDTDRLPRARWLENGLIDAGGSHEPYLFVVRRGGQPLDALDAYREQHSEELIRRLKEQGVEVFHTHLYKGFGMAAEKPEMVEAKRVAAIAHRHGLKVDSYIQWNSMMYETFFAEEPRAQNWIQRDAQGKPVMLVYGFQQSFRYRPCFSNREYLDYLKRIVRYAVEEVKTDFIHFDNFDLNPEPDSCHCGSCVRGFRDHLRTKYTAEKWKERFGFDNVDFVNPPLWNVQNPPANMEIIFDPAIQEWIDYRCQSMADALREMATYARSLNPEVAIEVNPHGITGGNRAWERGLDHARLLKWTDAFWTEEEDPPALLPDGRLLSRIRSFKLASAFQNILLTYISDHPLSMAESLAFNQTIGYAGNDPLTPEILEYIAFYRKNRELFLRTEDVATVAVLRSYPSIAYHNARAQLSAILAEQALIEARIPFNLVFDEHLADLGKYRLLVLPDSECLSDDQLESIKKFVKSGGGLVATGLVGLYDEWRRLRVRPGLFPLIESQPPAKAYEETVERTEAAGREVRRDYERGRVAYFPAIEFDGPLPPAEPYFNISNKYWKKPRNWREIAEAVRWAAKDDVPLRIGGPSHLVTNLVSQPAKNRLLLHLVNYSARSGRSVKGVEVALRYPAKAATLLAPDLARPLPLKTKTDKGTTRFTVPAVKVYAIVEVSR